METVGEEKTLGDEIVDFCIKNNVRSFAALCEYARKHNSDWFRFLMNGRCLRYVCWKAKLR